MSYDPSKPAGRYKLSDKELIERADLTPQEMGDLLDAWGPHNATAAIDGTRRAFADMRAGAMRRSGIARIAGPAAVDRLLECREPAEGQDLMADHESVEHSTTL